MNTCNQRMLASMITMVGLLAVHQGDTRRLEAVMRRLMDGESITIAAVGGSVTGALEHAAMMSCCVHFGTLV